MKGIPQLQVNLLEQECVTHEAWKKKTLRKQKESFFLKHWDKECLVNNVHSWTLSQTYTWGLHFLHVLSEEMLTMQFMTTGTRAMAFFPYGDNLDFGITLTLDVL